MTESATDQTKPDSKFAGILSDLEHILVEVKQSDSQLDHSLDLFEDALSKATLAAELSDSVDLSELGINDDSSDNSSDESSDEVKQRNRS